MPDSEPTVTRPFMQLSASIFKAYDIRGVVPLSLDVEVAEALGRAFGSAARAAGETSVAVGRDGRLSGPALVDALIDGLVATGVEVIDVGAVTTPMLYFAAHTLCTSGAAKGTAERFGDLGIEHDGHHASNVIGLENRRTELHEKAFPVVLKTEPL